MASLQILTQYWMVEYSYSIPYDSGGGGCSPLFTNLEDAQAWANSNGGDGDEYKRIYHPLVSEGVNLWELQSLLCEYGQKSKEDRELEAIQTFGQQIVDTYKQHKATTIHL